MDMSPIHRILLHHSEGVDPTLVEWIQDKIDELIGFQPAAIVLMIGVVIVLFPAGLLGLMWYQRRRASREDRP